MVCNHHCKPRSAMSWKIRHQWIGVQSSGPSPTAITWVSQFSAVASGFLVFLVANVVSKEAAAFMST